MKNPSAQTQQTAYFDIKSHQYNIGQFSNLPSHTSFEQDQLIEEAKKDRGNKIALDFGAGTGRITFALISAGFKVIALDPSKESLKNLCLEAKKRKIPRNRYTVTEKFPKNKTYRLIVGADVLHHVDLKKYTHILFKKLAKNGKLVFSEPGAWNPAWYIYLKLFHNWEIEKGIKQMSYHNISQLLKAANFTEVKIKGLGLLPMPIINLCPALHKINQLLANAPLLKYFAYRYLIIAKK